MAAPYTLVNLNDVKDSATSFGLADVQEARFAKDALEAEQTGVSHHRLKPDKRQAFGHKHDDAEEVYVVLSGSGRVKLDDEIRDISQLDAIRVAPGGHACFRGRFRGPGGARVRDSSRWRRRGDPGLVGRLRRAAAETRVACAR